MGAASGPGSRPAEVWIAVKGCGYEVSNLGRVRNAITGRILSTRGTDKDGYPIATFSINKRRRTLALHRLVAEAFHADKRNALHSEVAHLDGDRRNARADNLKWVGKIENHSHKRLHGTHQAGERHPRTKLSAEQVARIRTRYATSRIVAADFGISRREVFAIWQNERWANA